jgi:hypothetical protein
VLAGDPPGSAEAEARTAVQEAVRVDASGETDEDVDRAEDEDDGKRVLPEWHAHEGAPRGKHERRGQREDGEKGPRAALALALAGAVVISVARETGSAHDGPTEPVADAAAA